MQSQKNLTIIRYELGISTAYVEQGEWKHAAGGICWPCQPLLTSVDTHDWNKPFKQARKRLQMQKFNHKFITTDHHMLYCRLLLTTVHNLL